MTGKSFDKARWLSIDEIKDLSLFMKKYYIKYRVLDPVENRWEIIDI